MARGTAVFAGELFGIAAVVFGSDGLCYAPAEDTAGAGNVGVRAAQQGDELHYGVETDIWEMR